MISKLKALNGGLKTVSFAVVAGMYALTPLPFLEGDPTGLEMTLDLWYSKKEREMVKFVSDLSDNSANQTKKQTNIKTKEFYYYLHTE